MQGDVMKESMTAAKTLAWSLLTDEEATNTAKKMDETKRQGIHIHVPEGATPKDGPSGGTLLLQHYIVYLLIKLFATI